MHLLPHYLKVSVRNLRRYPMQTLISVIGLAAGFVCLSLSALWLHYENTYNTSLPDADRLYVIAGGTPAGFALQYDAMPEVETYAEVLLLDLTIAGLPKGEMARSITVDSCFTSVADVHIINGNADFFDTDLQGVAISATLARKLFGNEDPIGKVVSQLIKGGISMGMKVEAVYEDMDPHTDLCADIITCTGGVRWVGDRRIIITKLKAGKGVYDSFCRKAQAYIEEGKPMPLTPVPFAQKHHRQSGPLLDNAPEETFYIPVFLLVSLMLVACALIGYITFFVNRVLGRRREMALRTVHGAQTGGLLMLLLTEALLVLLAATIVGWLTTLLLREHFAAYAGIHSESYILRWSLLFMLAAVGGCMLVCIPAVIITRKITIRSSVDKGHRGNRTFMDISLGFQLTISLGFVFCCIMMLRQMQHLRDYDWGIRTEGVAALQLTGLRTDHEGVFIFGGSFLHKYLEDNGIPQELRAIPSVKSVMDEGRNAVFERSASMPVAVRRTGTEEWQEARILQGISDPANEAYGFTVLEGTLPRMAEWQTGQFIISESIRQAMGLEQAVGQPIEWKEGDVVSAGSVVCVIRDLQWNRVKSNDGWLYVFRPLTEQETADNRSYSITFTYDEAQEQQMKADVHALMDEKEMHDWSLHTGTEKLLEQTAGDRRLSHLVAAVAAACMIIALLGLFSIVTLACQQRRKEMAIRKIHGAMRGDVVRLFAREYGIVLAVSATVAFLLGGYVMQRWLEQFVQRTDMPWWLYVVLFLGAVLLITLCVGNRLLRTARENPADVVKSE
jgi:hypothetical protein